MKGQTISHYQILEKFGEDGVSVVYKAEDTEIDITVFVNFLITFTLKGGVLWQTGFAKFATAM